MAKSLHTLVLNSNFMPIGIMDSKDAFLNVFTEKVDMVEVYEGEFLHSPGAAWPVPSIIRARKYVDLPYKRAILTKKNIFKRDGYKCQYCGSKGTDRTLTWDHILPRSRKGPNTWENLTTACFKCNNEKDNFTPEEMGWDRPRTFHPHYLVTLNSFVKRTPEEWLPYLMVGS